MTGDFVYLSWFIREIVSILNKKICVLVKGLTSVTFMVLFLIATHVSSSASSLSFSEGRSAWSHAHRCRRKLCIKPKTTSKSEKCFSSRLRQTISTTTFIVSDPTTFIHPEFVTKHNILRSIKISVKSVFDYIWTLIVKQLFTIPSVRH